MKFILGKKINMTQLWIGDKVVPVTAIKAGPCAISQVKTKEKDGYLALQLAFGTRKEKNIKKPQLGHFKNSGAKPAHVREFVLKDVENYKIGDIVSANTFVAGDIVRVTGTSKGRGFQGVVKRHGFAGADRTHGNKDQERMPGSIGNKGPAHVFKGKRMPGRMGGARITTTNLEIVEVDEKENIIYIKGAIPGSTNSLVLIKAPGELKVNTMKEEIKEEKVVETKEDVKPELKEEKVQEAKAEELKPEVKEEKVEEAKAEDKKEEKK